MSELPLETIAGHKTRVLRMGSGQRRALFIHCTLAHAGAWTGVQAALLDKLSMTSFDRPGHGQAADWTGGRDGKAIHDLTTQMAGRLINKRADVIGHSYGGTVALRLAMEWPDHVRSLVMIEPVLFAAIAGTPAYGPVEAFLKQVEALVDAGDTLAAAKLFSEGTNPSADFDALSPERQARLARRIELVVAESGATLVDSTGMLAPGRLEKIKQPVLLLESANPPGGVREVHEALAARIPQVQRVIIGGADHMAPLTHPDNVAGEIAAFLKV